LFEQEIFDIMTCEFCLSHYLTAALLILAGYKSLYSDWRGYLIAVEIDEVLDDGQQSAPEKDKND
jgi:hypothetical protein